MAPSRSARTRRHPVNRPCDDPACCAPATQGGGRAAAAPEAAQGVAQGAILPSEPPEVV